MGDDPNQEAQVSDDLGVPKQPEPDCLRLALRLATIIENMRAEARFNLETFVAAAEGELGGQLHMAAPRKAGKKRPCCEARYMGESDIASA